MLIKCPECELQVSDKATSCPHCGYPFKDTTAKQRNKKHMRLPNGFGQITEIKGKNLRNPFRVMITVGKNENGKPICKLLKPTAFFKTYNDAYAALVEYNRNPYDLDSDMTVAQLYDKWSEEYFKKYKSESGKRTMNAAWAYCSAVYDMRVADLRARHIKGCIDEGKTIIKGKETYPSADGKARIKSLFNKMLDYAVEYELTDKNYSRAFNLSSDIVKQRDENKQGHMPYTDVEMEILWNNVDRTEYVDILLIQCYSGWRPQELGLIEIKNVDIENWTFTGGMKTEAGTNRIVPIHSKIRELVKKNYDYAVSMGSKYLFNSLNAKSPSEMILTYDKYYHRFVKIKEVLRLHPDHRAHDGRMHFITMAKKYSVDEYAIKYMVGHNIADVTEKVYTVREIDWLKAEIEKIK